MKANELRIGNYVSADGLHGGKVMTVDEIGMSGTMRDGVRVILFKEHHVGEFVHDVNPIPLTEKWLKDFGFEERPNVEWMKCKGALCINTGNHNIWTYGRSAVREPKYVHQLQNLYFALTGDELTLQPTDESQ